MLISIAKIRTPPDPLFFYQEKHSGHIGQTDSDPHQDLDISKEKAVLCRACQAVVTGLNQAVSINDNHMHTFFNPAGIVYEIRCFAKAKGCVNHGKPTDEFSWFTGYTWEYSLCSTCFDHLGWFFRSGDGSFFGLINSKLIFDEASS